MFAYGQTCTGKTFTMRGYPNHPGMMPLAIKEIFSLSHDITVKISYFEVYNETVNDLLNPKNRGLEVRESVQKGIFVANLTEIDVGSYPEALDLLERGDRSKTVAETKLNENSSRSHSLFKMTVKSKRDDKAFEGTMFIVDLAGSENASKAKTEGIRMKEGTNINKSLLALSNVISKLSSNSSQFINYRDSKLTRILQPMLSGNSKTLIFCTMTQKSTSYSETINTLYFGTKAKNIKTTVTANEVTDERTRIMKENLKLKARIQELEQQMMEKKTEETFAMPIKQNFTETMSVVEPKEESIKVLEKEIKIIKQLLMRGADENGINDSAWDARSTVSSIYPRSMALGNEQLRVDDFDCVSTISQMDRPFFRQNSWDRVETTAVARENEDLKRTLREERYKCFELANQKDAEVRKANYMLNSTKEEFEERMKRREEEIEELRLNYNKTRNELREKERKLEVAIRTANNLEHKIEATFGGDLLEKYEELKAITESTNNLEMVDKLKEENMKLREEVCLLNCDNMSFRVKSDLLKKHHDLAIKEKESLNKSIDSYKSELNQKTKTLSKIKYELINSREKSGDKSERSSGYKEEIMKLKEKIKMMESDRKSTKVIDLTNCMNEANLLGKKRQETEKKTPRKTLSNLFGLFSSSSFFENEN